MIIKHYINTINVNPTISEHGVINHFVLRTNNGVNLLGHHHRVRVSLVADHISRFQGRVVTLHDDPDSRHHVTSWAFLHLVYRRGVANFSIDLLVFVAGPDQLRWRWQRGQTVPHARIIGLQLDGRRWYFQHASRDGSLHRLLGVLILTSLMRGSFRFQTGVTFLRSHGYLWPHRERERGRFLRGIAISVTLSEFRNSFENAVSGALLRLLVPFLRSAPLQVFQPIFQTLQNRLGLRLRLDLLQIHLLQALNCRRLQFHRRHSRLGCAIPDRSTVK